jgi:hypothetical protein
MSTYYRDGGFHIVNANSGYFASVSPTRFSQRIADFACEADLTKLAGPDNVRYGLQFRHDAVRNDSYHFNITGAGNLQVARWVESLRSQGGWDSLLPLTVDRRTVINAGNASNRLKVVARGPEITVSVNDVPLRQLVENKITMPVIGTIGINVGEGLSITVSAVRVFAVD